MMPWAFLLCVRGHGAMTPFEYLSLFTSHLTDRPTRLEADLAGDDGSVVLENRRFSLTVLLL